SDLRCRFDLLATATAVMTLGTWREPRRSGPGWRRGVFGGESAVIWYKIKGFRLTKGIRAMRGSAIAASLALSLMAMGAAPVFAQPAPAPAPARPAQPAPAQPAQTPPAQPPAAAVPAQPPAPF